MVRIVAALAWYDEPLEFLDRLVRSLAGHADHLVAVDGAWQHFPGGKPGGSGAEQQAAIRDAAADVGVHADIYAPLFVYESQVAKRAELFRLAIETYGADWVLVVDGDTHVARCDDAGLRDALGETRLDVATPLVTQMNRPWPYSELPTRPQAQRHLYRGIQGLTVRHAHNGILTPDGRWLNGDLAYVSIEPALDVSDLVELAHDNANRGAARNTAAKAYRKNRDREQLEAWV